jgi:hypothetical protein
MDAGRTVSKSGNNHGSVMWRQAQLFVIGI